MSSLNWSPLVTPNMSNSSLKHILCQNTDKTQTWWATATGQAFLPRIPPIEQAWVGFRYLLCTETLVQSQLCSLWPHHHVGKQTPQGEQDVWTVWAQGSKSVDSLPYLYPNLIMLMCSHLFPLASCWVFSSWINGINGVSRTADSGLGLCVPWSLVKLAWRYS